MILCKLKEDFQPQSPRLLSFASQLKHGRGLSVVGSVLAGSFTYEQRAKDVHEAKQVLKMVMKEEKVKGFMKVITAEDVKEGISFLIQASGLGALEPNTVLLAWPENWRERDQWRSFVQTVNSVALGESALLVPRGIDAFPDNHEKLEGYIDVWWIVHDGGMMILILFLLRMHKVWRRCKLRIFTVAQLEDNSIQMKADLETFIYHLRIKATVEVIEMVDQDISAYTYERTLKMEQRTEMLKRMKLSRKESKREIQNVVETSYRTRSTSYFKATHSESVGANEANKITGHVSPRKETVISEPSVEFDRRFSYIDEHALLTEPGERNVRRMNTAVKLNEIVKQKSGDSQLIVVNLPAPPDNTDEWLNYMEFLDVLTDGVDKVLMVRGGGYEVVTIYS